MYNLDLNTSTFGSLENQALTLLQCSSGISILPVHNALHSDYSDSDNSSNGYKISTPRLDVSQTGLSSLLSMQCEIPSRVENSSEFERSNQWLGRAPSKGLLLITCDA